MGNITPSLFSLKNFNVNRYSYSQLKTYLQCPLRYKFRYIDKKLKQDQEATFYLSIGRSLHNFLARIYQTDFIFNYSPESIKYELRKDWITKGFQNNKEESEWFDKCSKMVQNLLADKNYKRKPLLVERTFLSAVENFEIKSKIDRIDKLNEAECEIIDYKVGESEISPDVLKDDLQWAFHYLSSFEILENIYKLKITRITFIFLDAVLKEYFYPDQEKVKDALKSIKGIVELIESKEMFEPKLNKFCTDCRYKVICPLIKKLKKQNIDIQTYINKL